MRSHIYSLSGNEMKRKNKLSNVQLFKWVGSKQENEKKNSLVS